MIITTATQPTTTTVDVPTRRCTYHPVMKTLWIGLILCHSRTLAEDTASSVTSCNLKCKNGGTCAFGEADFSSHPQADLGGSSTDFANQTSIDGMHCKCPSGYTGVTCDVPYGTCDGTAHPCYNNGKCVPGAADQYGNEQLFCNCADAVVNGIPHVGKYCEHAANEYCDDAKTVFCIHGTCNRDYPSGGGPCSCDTGYSGPSCQYEAGAVPECDLACQNGGVCSLDNSGDEPAYMYWEDGGSKQHESMWCKCPEGYKGRLCDVVSVPCGDSWCFHGGTCLEHSIDGKVQYDCDCTPTYTDEASYAGTMCQFAATSYCSKSSGGVNGNLFCTNHGRCNDHPEQGCDCDDPYTGFSCEFVLQDSMNNSTASIIRNNGTDDVWLGDDANITPIDGTLVYDELDDIKCDLKCQHGGTCQVGVKDNGVLEDIAQKSVPSLNVSDDSESSFMHCVCPDGYYGNLCESLVEICGDNEHMCLHGGKCIRNDQDEHACDCSTEETEKVPSVIYAGEACEHAVPRSNVCSDEGYSSMETSPVSFCIHGTCKQRVAAGESHPGCFCEPGFNGPHCEIRETITFRDKIVKNSSRSSVSAGQIIAIVAVLVVIIVGGFLAWILVKRRGKRKYAAKSMRWGDSLYRDGYRDEPGSGINIAPRRSSSVYDETSIHDYSVSMHSSSTDPMATILAPKTPVAPAEADDDEDPEPRPTVYIGPPRDEDGHVLHNVEIC